MPCVAGWHSVGGAVVAARCLGNGWTVERSKAGGWCVRKAAVPESQIIGRGGSRQGNAREQAEEQRIIVNKSEFTQPCNNKGIRCRRISRKERISASFGNPFSFVLTNPHALTRCTTRQANQKANRSKWASGKRRQTACEDEGENLRVSCLQNSMDRSVF